MQYFHDFRVGDTVALGVGSLTESEIRQFNGRYDPQAQYLDESVAGPMHGGIVASNWHVAALGQGLLVSGLLNQTAHLGTPCVQNLNFLKPVKPDEPLWADLTVLEVDDDKANPDRGNVSAQIQIVNDDDEPVLQMVSVMIVARKSRN